MAQVRDFDVSQLSGVLIVCGHYGVGKTAFSLSLVKDAAARENTSRSSTSMW